MTEPSEPSVPGVEGLDDMLLERVIRWYEEDADAIAHGQVDFDHFGDGEDEPLALLPKDHAAMATFEFGLAAALRREAQRRQEGRL